MELNYKKNKNENLFKKMCDPELLDLENIQNYIPLYNVFFDLNESNYNNINLNNKYRLTDVNEKKSYSKFNCIINDNSDNACNKEVFFKYSPLVDPIKYMIGKYELSYNIFNLPKLNKEENTLEKVLDPNNSAYSDGFFYYLSSLLLTNYNFINGINYYGSFISNKNNFIVNIEDDIEYLDDSDFFHKNNNILFKITNNNNNNLFSNTKKNRTKIELSNLDEDFDIDIVDSIIDITYNNSIENNTSKLELTYTNVEKNNNEDNNEESKLKNNKKQKTNENNNTKSSCSSRYSNTESVNSESNNDDESNETSSIESDSSNEEDIFMSINKFPVQVICLECCENTLDDYISNNKIKDNEWESIVLQILFTLITYQKVFDFTHNDLHTNNIVYNSSEKKFIYYKFNNKHYKIPTFGKIYKIIDFGRAIYKFKGKQIISDSYSQEGDAATQYNCEPYLNTNKPRLDPNYSFDLCRLGCSLFDYLIDDIDDIKKLKSPIKKIMVYWIFDDKNKNILYKNDGSERYPDFKLYKMIARTVHNHSPQKVLKNELFDKYTISKKKINNPEAIFNIDNMPIMT
tara:strand:- start:2323 stop:4041 length:1719 start_codon:yes stop_codon:yes gene_type:complete